MNGVRLPVLVVACGNPLRGDDGVGWEIAQALEKDCRAAELTVLTVHQLTPELSEELSSSELVILIDASDEGSPAGSVSTRVVTGDAPSCLASSHHLSLSALLGLTAGIFGWAPPALVVSVAVASTEPEIGLSEAMRGAIPVAVDAVLSVVEGNRAVHA